MNFDVTDLAGMPVGPMPNRDLVSSWSLESMQTHINAQDRVKANALTHGAVHCHHTGHGRKEHHQSREGAVLAYLIAAENSAVHAERGWYAARVDAYAALHGIRGWYRTTDHRGIPVVYTNRLRKTGTDGDRGRYFVHGASSTGWGPERLRPFWVVDRDTGRTAYRAPTRGIAAQWIDEREHAS